MNLNQPSGLTVSPDFSKLYVTSFQNASVIQYDYDSRRHGGPDPGGIRANAADGLASGFGEVQPERQYGLRVESRRNGRGPLQSGRFERRCAGERIDRGRHNFPVLRSRLRSGRRIARRRVSKAPAGANGAVAKSGLPVNWIFEFIGPGPSLNGASGLLVQGNSLYVTSMFAGNISRYDVNSGVLDPGFSVTGLAFPQGIMLAPDGNGCSARGFAEGTETFHAMTLAAIS